MAKLSAAQRKSFLAMKAPFRITGGGVFRDAGDQFFGVCEFNEGEIVCAALNHYHRTLKKQDRDRKDARKYGKYGWNS